jgi:hypothetical protein
MPCDLPLTNTPTWPPGSASSEYSLVPTSLPSAAAQGGGMMCDRHRHRHRPRPFAVDDGEIRVAQAGSADSDQHFVAARWCQRQLLDDQRPGILVGMREPDLAQDGGACFHMSLLHESV